ncbi:hypothetical protein GGF46_002114 [Coemansia sp. RSA 552]|nr:hypothetical protein GGF46_002114 [Coemansia sp. RSA 552]
MDSSVGEVAPISPVSQDAKDLLSRQLSQRPTAEELRQQHVLREQPGVAPQLQATMVELERHRVEDKLERKLEARPTRQDLVNKHVLEPAMPDPERHRVEGQLEQKLAARPTPKDLVDQHILDEDEQL